MAESGTNNGGSESIDLSSEAECAHWVQELSAPLGEIKAAVHHVGPRAEDVRQYLKERSLPPRGDAFPKQ